MIDLVNSKIFKGILAISFLVTAFSVLTLSTGTFQTIAALLYIILSLIYWRNFKLVRPSTSNIEKVVNTSLYIVSIFGFALCSIFIIITIFIIKLIKKSVPF